MRVLIFAKADFLVAVTAFCCNVLLFNVKKYIIKREKKCQHTIAAYDICFGLLSSSMVLSSLPVMYSHKSLALSLYLFDFEQLAYNINCIIYSVVARPKCFSHSMVYIMSAKSFSKSKQRWFFFLPQNSFFTLLIT